MEVMERELIKGNGKGELLFADIGISFWGGVDPVTGVIIDHTHPLKGESIAGKVLAIPNGRGSCTGSQVILELLLGENAPVALVLSQPDVIISLGVIVAQELFGKSIPIVSLGKEKFEKLGKERQKSLSCVLSICGGKILINGAYYATTVSVHSDETLKSNLVLTKEEQDMLSGKYGDAMKVAMRILTRAAVIMEAPKLEQIKQAHIDGCTYIGQGGLNFAKKLVELGGKVSVPTTLNSVSVDRRRWRALGVSSELGEPATALGDAYTALGCTPSFTCAPYLLDSAPGKDEQIAWGESNAVVFANSVLGARTQKYADYLDICAALTGRIPLAGPHLCNQRLPSVLLNVNDIVSCLNRVDEVAVASDDASFAALGYLCGLKAGARIPLIVGLEKYCKESKYLMDGLKAFSAAFGTSGAAALYHIAGVTPEAKDEHFENLQFEEKIDLSAADLANVWDILDGSSESNHANSNSDVVDLVAFGNPHLSITECALLAALCKDGPKKHVDVNVVATLGRDVHRIAEERGYVSELEKFGLQFITDTCWCMLTEPVIPVQSKTIITNSAKFAHYGPALTNGRTVRFASVGACLTAARNGRVPSKPNWVMQYGKRGLSYFARRRVR
eukprot:g5302.t1